MEIIFTLLGIAVLLTVFAAIGHGVWLILAGFFRLVTGTQSPPITSVQANSPESDLAQSYLAVDRLYRGKLLSADAFHQACKILENAAAERQCELPWIPSKRIVSDAVSAADTSLETAENSSLQHLETTNPVLFNRKDAKDSVVCESTQSLEHHPLEKNYAPSPPPFMDSLAKQTKRTLGNVLQQFLSEKNIHWGELVSALLIVGSAVGLILSLRTELNRLIPMFPSLLFFLVTLAIHLAGFYTLKRWKLPSTSRGLLVLGSVMMCVTSLATVMLTEQSSAPVSSLVSIVFGLVGFGTLAYMSSHSLFPGMKPLWTVAVTWSGLTPLILGRLLENDPPLEQWKWICLMAVLGPAIAALGLMVLHFGFRLQAGVVSLRSQLRLLGITFIGALFACGLIVFLLRGQPGGLTSFSLMLSAFGGLLICAGSIVLFKSEDPDSRMRAELSESIINRVAVIGSAASFLGAAVMVLSLGSAWSDSQLFLEASCFNAIVSVVLVVLWRQPTLTVIASAFAGTSCWLLAHRFAGEFPTPSMRWSWFIDSAGTMRSSITFFVLAVVYAFLALRSVEKHRVVLLIACGFTAFSGLGGAGYLGCTARETVLQVYSISCFAIVGLGITLIGPWKARVEPAIIGSFLLLIAWGILARPSTDLSIRWGTSTGRLVDFAAIALSGHAITMSMIAGVAGLFRQRSARLGALPILSRGWPGARMETAIADTGLLTTCLCIPFLLRFAPTDHWLWQALTLAMLAFGCWIGWVVGRGSHRESLAWFTTGCSICFFLALGINGTSVSGDLEASSLSVSIAAVLILGTVCSLLLKNATRLFRSPFALKAWSTTYGDGLLLAVGAIFVFHLLVEQRDWWRSVLASRSNASLWTIGVIAIFACSIILTLTRQRSRYLWVTGVLSSLLVFTLFGIWNTRGGDELAFIYLLLGAPQLVAGIANAIDIYRKQKLEIGVPTKARYEKFVAIGTLLSWTLATSIGYIGSTVNPTSQTYGLWSIVGGAWVVVGLVSFWFAGHVINRRHFVGMLLLGTLVVSANLPIAIARFFFVSLDRTTSHTLILVGVAFQILIVSWFVVRGIALIPWIRFYLDTDNAETRGEVRRICWSYANLFSIGVGALSLFSAVATTNSEVVRTLGLVVSILAFANGLLVRRGNDESSSLYLPIIPAVFNRFLMVIFISLFMLFVVWSRLEFFEPTVLVSQRILRAAAVMIATTLGLGIAYAWLSTLYPNNDHREEQVSITSEGGALPQKTVLDAIDSHRSVVRFPLQSWFETLCVKWYGASLLSVMFLMISLIAVAVTTNERTSLVSRLVPRETFATEAIWIAILTSVWSVQLVVQALRSKWNVALLPSSLRSGYVYMAEVAGVMAVAILISVFPDWFRLPMREYWPVLMLLTAVVVQGVAMILKRGGVSAVGDPLRNTSMLLPLIAPLAMLFIASESSLELVLALGALFYFFLGATERSRQMAMLGGALANGALLTFWTRFDTLDFSRHPQLWLIPPAASIALATHVERDRISRDAASWLRYLCMATIFCSSSSEILIQGIGRTLWPPMVLMILSVLVGFVGIAFQIKPYLYSSILFTLFAVIAMVAHAQQSVQHTWPWWVLGISLGVGILVLFATFEKKRDQLTKLSERLKAWE